MWSALALLVFVPFTLAASFTSAPEVQKLDYSQLKPKSVLIEELSKAEGVPNFDSANGLRGWIRKTMNERLPVSESVARWVMLAGSGRCYECRQFFEYVMDKFGYASLVKDMIDYNGSSYYLTEYLKRNRLKHFPDLPASLRNAVAEMTELSFHITYLYPLMSDYSINHPAIQRSCTLSSTETFPPSLFKFTLICLCLGAIELHPHFYVKTLSI